MGKKLKEADAKHQEEGTGSDQASFPDLDKIRPSNGQRMNQILKEKSWERN
ncbi:MAG: hypothetical protein P8P74_11175 [Crocinitomicaceae bacterium]|nr:hypothetical protein [Crocinitomicaceae bacterium]